LKTTQSLVYDDRTIGMLMKLLTTLTERLRTRDVNPKQTQLKVNSIKSNLIWIN